jgi:hypothetical protein
MKDCGLKYDWQGRGRSLYSLRHYFITTRLQAGTDPYRLAKLCGTSVRMIETFYDESETEDYVEDVTRMAPGLAANS